MNFPDPGYSDRWSAARGMLGDYFQRYILKSFLAAYAQYASGSDNRASERDVGRAVRERHDKLLRALAERHAVSPEEAIENLVDGAVRALRVLDLGCGEAFLGRWLVGMGASYLGLDFTPGLLKDAQAKATTEGVVTPVEYCDLTQEIEGLPERLESFAAGVWGEAWPNLVTLTGVLEHVPDFAGLMGGLADWSRRAPNGSKPDFAIATLNPFFFRSLPDLEAARATDPSGYVDIHLAVSDSATKAMLRWPIEYERAFVQAGFHVLSCVSPDLGRLPKELQTTLAPKCGDRLGRLKPGQQIHVGPFVLWILRPRSAELPVDREDLADFLNESGALGAISKLACSLPTTPELYRVKFAPGEVIEHSGGLGGRCFAVIDGTVIRYTGETKAQAFKRGEILGEFEAGTNSASDRYRDDLLAGNDGCELLEIPYSTVALFLDRPEAAAASILFTALRGRMSQYSWTWLDRVADKGAGSHGVAPRTYVLLARALLFALSRERAESDNGAPAVIVADSSDLKKLILGEDGGELFKPALRLLKEAGIIDVNIWETAYRAERDEDKKATIDLAKELWCDIVDGTYDLAAKSAFKGADFDWVKKSLKEIVSEEDIKFRRVLNKNLLFTTDVRSILSNPRDKGSTSKHREDIVRWFSNLGSIQENVFLKNGLIFLRDEAALRDIVRYSAGDDIINNRVFDPEQQGAHGMEMARWVEYREVTLNHVLATLSRRPYFATTAEKIGVDPPLAEKLDQSA
jgi:SAM-dependent methyltransferase